MMASYERDFKYDDETDSVDGPSGHWSTTSPLVRGNSMEQTRAYMTTLESAIQGGNTELAVEMAKILANMHTSVCVKTDMSFREDLISCTINVEDLTGPKHSFVWKLQPTISIHSLKWKIFDKFGYPPDVQKWVVGKKLVDDQDKLIDCGVTSSGSVIFIYLLTSPTVQALSQEPAFAIGVYSRQMSEVSSGSGSLYDNRQLIQKILPSSTELRLEPQPVRFSALEQVGWQCPQCTLINEPTRPGCEACSFERPVDYQPPADYNPSEKERRRLEEVHKFDELLSVQNRTAGSAWQRSESTHDVVDRPLTDEELANQLQQQELMLLDHSLPSSGTRLIR